MIEIGVSTFGEIPAGNTIEKGISGNRRMKELLEEVKLADQVGLDVFAFGEHHRADFVIAAPEVIMAAAAAVTKRIKLSSAVTVLSTADPVRTFQQFATVDLISSGRTEIMAGRGAFTESFPLFGFEFADANDLFNEKIELLMILNAREFTNWTGKFRQPIPGMGVYPRPYRENMPVWFAVSRTAVSAEKAARLGLPLSISMFGGTPQQFVPLVTLYREALQQAHGTFGSPQIAVATQFYVNEDSEKATDEFFPSYEKLMSRIAGERGLPPVTREQFDHLKKDGPLVIGNIQQAIDKILYFYELFGNTRYLAHIDGGLLSHIDIMNAIELLGTRIAPAVRKAVAKTAPEAING